MKHITSGHIIGSGAYNDILELLTVEEESKKYHTVYPQQCSCINGSIEVEKNELMKSGILRKVVSSKSGSFGSFLHRSTLNAITKVSCSPKYVIKQLRTDLTSSSRKDGIIHLSAEAKLLEKIKHPNVIALHSIGGHYDSDHGFFLVIERIDIDISRQILLWNEDEARMKLSKSMSRDEKQAALESALYDRIEIANQVAAALFYLHEQKIIHRDMKPQNIGLDKHNNAKIYDFGMAKELHDYMKDIESSRKHKYDTYTATQCVGSPRYMAPEVNRGFKYGFRADIYSFTLVLWELMSLQICFDDISNIIDLASNVYEKKVRPDIKKDWPKELKRLLRRGWHHDPLNRPEAADFCDELQICMRQRMLNIYTNL